MTAALVALLLAWGVGGCETASQDLADFGKTIIPPSPGEAARMALDPHNPDRRREGTLLLSNSDFGGDEVYVRMYRDYVEHEQDPLVRAVAIRALARHGEPADATLIAAQLDQPNVQVRWEAAKGLQRLHLPSVVPLLLDTLRDPEEHTDVRVAAATALGQYAQDRSFQGLVAALDARELSVNIACERSLQTITGQDLGLDPRPWLNWYNGTADDPFADRRPFLYPTYSRTPSFLERLVFWSQPKHEDPGPPAGLEESAPSEPDPSSASE
ncbi:MAG: hypothetical protein GY715_21155 [Planctomycetes bacterium]|nr:hypothetical protein [Planctomycetota bacterium]